MSRPEEGRGGGPAGLFADLYQLTMLAPMPLAA